MAKKTTGVGKSVAYPSSRFNNYDRQLQPKSQKSRPANSQEVTGEQRKTSTRVKK